MLMFQLGACWWSMAAALTEPWSLLKLTPTAYNRWHRREQGDCPSERHRSRRNNLASARWLWRGLVQRLVCGGSEAPWPEGRRLVGRNNPRRQAHLQPKQSDGDTAPQRHRWIYYATRNLKRYLTHDTLLRTKRLKTSRYPPTSTNGKTISSDNTSSHKGYQWLKTREPCCLHYFHEGMTWKEFVQNGKLARESKSYTNRQILLRAGAAVPKSVWIIMATGDFTAGKQQLENYIGLAKGWYGIYSVFLIILGKPLCFVNLDFSQAAHYDLDVPFCLDNFPLLQNASKSWKSFLF